MEASHLFAGIAISAMAWATVPITAHAQTAENVDNITGSSVSKLFDTDEIVVTARRRAETLINVPVAVSAVGGQELEKYAINGLTAIGTRVPQVILARSPGAGSGAAFSIRGIGSGHGDPGVDQSVALNLDGVQVSRGRIVTQGFFDITQVEVLKGPQALFFGKNSPVGVISITTAGPTDDLSGQIKAGYEFNADELILEGFVAGPISDTLGFRVAGRYSHADGYMRNDAQPMPILGLPTIPSGLQGVEMPGAHDRRQPGYEEYLGRLTLAYNPSDDFDATLKIFGSHRSENGMSFAQITGCEGQPTTRGIADPYGSCKLDGHRSSTALPSALARNYPGANGGVPYTKTDVILASLNMNYQVSNLTISSITGYYHYNFRGFDNFEFTSLGGVWGSFPEKYSSFSQEIRINSDFEGLFNFSAGGLYEDSTRRNMTDNYLQFLDPDPATGRYYTIAASHKNDGKVYTLFGQARVDLQQNLELAAGVRWTRTKKSAFMVNTYLNANATALGATRRAIGVPLEAKYTEENWSPEATLTWHPVDEMTLYVAYKHGWKPGGITTPQAGIPSFFTADNVVFNEEKVKGGEIGFKAQLFDRRLTTTVAAYRYKYTDLQQSSIDSATLLQRTSNAASARTTGIEVDTRFRATRELTMHGNVAYSHARFLSFPSSPCYAFQSSTEGCVGGVQNLSGKQMFRAPEWTGAAGISYDIPVGGPLMIGLDADMRYSSSYYVNTLQTPSSRQSGFAVLNAAARLYTDGKGWELALIGRNLTNKWYMTAADDKIGGGPGMLAPATDAPRTVIVRGTYSF